MRKLIQIPFLILILMGANSCSSNNTGQDDLSIAEIEEIEKTGEFSEEDFFNDEEVLDGEGLDAGLDDAGGDLDIEDDAELLSDVDIEDFEGENFDTSNEFETDISGDAASAEFDEFDEFVTDENVAQNEGFEDFEDFEDGTMIAEDAGSGDDFEEDIFAEFEDSETAMDDSISGEPAQEQNTVDELNFEDAFQEQPQQDDIALDDGMGSGDLMGDDMFAEEPMGLNDAASGDEVIATGEVFETNEPTASELVGDDFSASETTKSNELVPVKKMKPYPFRRSGILLNALYVVRPGDNFNSIKNKIYGPGSAANLARLNPTLRPNNLEVGEKVYYNSPNRPNDESQMLFFYDDVGAAAQSRNIASGENIRTVSEEILGHPRSWMEVWATNPNLESKWAVNKSQSIRYFPTGTAVPAQNLAQNNEPEVIEPVPEESTSVATNMNNEPDFDQSMPAEEPGDPFAEEKTGEAVGGMGEPSMNDNAGLGEDPMSNGGEEPNFDQGFEDNAMADDNMGGEPDFDQGFDDQAANEPNFDQGFDEPAVNDQGMAGNGNPDAATQAIPETFKANGGAKGPFGLDKQMFDTILMGAGGLLLLLGILMFARMRRKKAEANVQDFDFGGETTQIDEQTKTHIDI